jgi:hypothetical protein
LAEPRIKVDQPVIALDSLKAFFSDVCVHVHLEGVNRHTATAKPAVDQGNPILDSNPSERCRLVLF